jgi:glycine betaine/proline transport system permease protein
MGAGSPQRRLAWLLLALAALAALGAAPGPDQRVTLTTEVEARSVIPAEDWIDRGIDWVAVNFRDFFDAVKAAINTINSGILWVLEVFPLLKIWVGASPISVPLLALVVAPYLYYAGSWSTGLFGLVALLLIANVGLWVETLETLSLTLTAAFVALFFGIPLGILAGRVDTVDTVVRPILDFMQTLPVFVYLIPAVILFGLGPAPGVVATVIFALPPAVRLTSLGIRQVPHELVEAGEAFGCNDLQLLFKVQIPMARESIMAGVNQTIMLSLSMVVIAALIGSGGLGGEVVRSIQRMLVGKGFVAGIAVVFLAIILDRATRSLGKKA